MTAFKRSISETELTQRTRRLQHRMQQHQIDAALIIQKCDLYYLCGTLQEAHLWIPADAAPILMVYKNLARAQAESALENIVSLDSPKSIPDLLKRHGQSTAVRIGLELDVLPVQRFFQYQRLLPAAELVDISNQLRQIRAVKSPYELKRMQQAAVFSDRLAGFAAEQIEAGMTELALAGRIEAHARQLGHQGLVRMRMWNSELFYGHLMAGAAAAVPSFLASPTGGIGASAAVSQGASARPLQPNEPILLDYVFVHEGYINDQARIYSIGSLPDDLMAAHEAMLAVQKTISDAAKPGAVTGELYRLALNTAANLGFGDYFMGADPRRIRFVGHGVGLELDEYPFLAQGQTMALAENMTIALEPKLIFPGRGVVGIENTHVVTPDGLRPFGRYPEEITIIE